MTSLITSKRWNDRNVLTHEAFRTLLANWDVADHEGSTTKAELLILHKIMKSRREVCSVRVWLQSAFEPKKLEPNFDTVKIYLNFFSKLDINDDDAFRYLNNERRKRDLGVFLDKKHLRTVPQPIPRLVAPKIRFRKTKAPVARASVDVPIKTDDYDETKNRPSFPARPSVKLQPISQGVPVRLDEPGSCSATAPEKSAGISVTESEGMAEKTVFSAKIAQEDETLPSQDPEEVHEETFNLQTAQEGVPSDARHLGNKLKGLVHDVPSASGIGDGLSVPVGCLDQTVVDQMLLDEPRRTKRRKLDHSFITITASRSLQSNPCSLSNELPCIPQGKPNEDGESRGEPFLIPSAKGSNERTKGKRPRNSQPKGAGPETHPLQDVGILDVCCQPSSDHDHLAIPDGFHLVIMESEGRQQAQDSQPTNEGLELVTIKGRQLDSKPQLSMAVLDSEGPRENFLPFTSVPMEDSEKFQHQISSNTDNSKIPVSKAALPHLPPIWAESRQEVCEAFDWFRSYQGGVYHTDNAVKGYLLSAFASERDAFEINGRLIISHGGGKSESVGSQKGLFVSNQASDQLADDMSVRALLSNYRCGRPIVLMVDDKYALFPYDLSSKRVTYAVLGFYTIVYAWAEFQTAKNEVGRVIRYKFAFRWCEEQGTPWWCFSDDTSLELSRDEGKASGVPRIVSEDDFSCKSFPRIPNLQTARTCSFCECPSHQVYSTWVCLATNCEMFWKNPETKEFAPDNLEYNREFFTLSPRLALSFGLNLIPDTTVTRATNGTSTSYAFTRGIHCPDCGRLSSRYQWEKLECRACNWTKMADINIRPAEDFWCDRLPISFEYFQMGAVSDFIPEPILSFKHDGGRGTIQTFTLPHNRGHIHHIRTPSTTGMLPANKIFEHYQKDAKSGNLTFRRWPLKAHKCRGTLLTNYFSHNAGEPYQYVGSDANTVPFEQVPAVIEARQLIQDRILQSLNRTSEFNEVLSCAYMERQKMAFHSDAEVGLGPLVAGLSLGSPALMHFRIVARHDPLYERRGVLLTVVLRHGDVLVMDGNGVQEYYEHTVVPNNFRIAATARQITPIHHNP